MQASHALAVKDITPDNITLVIIEALAQLATCGLMSLIATSNAQFATTISQETSSTTGKD